MGGLQRGERKVVLQTSLRRHSDLPGVTNGLDPAKPEEVLSPIKTIYDTPKGVIGKTRVMLSANGNKS